MSKANFLSTPLTPDLRPVKIAVQVRRHSSLHARLQPVIVRELNPAEDRPIVTIDKEVHAWQRIRP